MKAENNANELQNLIISVKNGDQAAFNALLAQYEPLVITEVMRYGDEIGDFDRDDLRQVAWLALYRAAFSFDIAQSEVSFGLYAKICVSNALSTQVRAMRRRAAALPLCDEWCAEQEAEEGDPAQYVREAEALQLLRTRIRALLSPFENRVWALFTAGCGVKEIARRLEKEPRSIENAVYRIRQKLRAGLEKDGK